LKPASSMELFEVNIGGKEKFGGLLNASFWGGTSIVAMMLYIDLELWIQKGGNGGYWHSGVAGENPATLILGGDSWHVKARVGGLDCSEDEGPTTSNWSRGRIAQHQTLKGGKMKGRREQHLGSQITLNTLVSWYWLLDASNKDLASAGSPPIYCQWQVSSMTVQTWPDTPHSTDGPIATHR
jgi:hypothetical protein